MVKYFIKTCIHLIYCGKHIIMCIGTYNMKGVSKSKVKIKDK